MVLWTSRPFPLQVAYMSLNDAGLTSPVLAISVSEEEPIERAFRHMRDNVRRRDRRELAESWLSSCRDRRGIPGSLLGTYLTV